MKIKYITLLIIQSIAIGAYSGICIWGWLLPWFKDQIEISVFESVQILAVFAGLMFIIVKTGGKMDVLLGKIKK